MAILYFDCFAGISGDMTLGAFVDLGVPEGYLKDKLNSLAVNEFDISFDRTNLSGISGTICHVDIQDKHTHRHLADILDIINCSSLDENEKKLSRAIFMRVAAAEAKVHGIAIDEVHFHEVGAMDSIADIVGAAVCINYISPERIVSSPLNIGSGYVKCSHGIMPVPAPAVAEILADSNLKVYSKYIKGESVTPTGAAILAEVAGENTPTSAFSIKRTGYGYGSRKFDIPNVLRLMICEEDFKSVDDRIVTIEANIDDMTPEAFGHALDKMFKAGAKDAFYTPIYMKKNRPAIKLTVLSDIKNKDLLIETILKETTTAGVRTSLMDRVCMDRKFELIDTDYGTVRVKKFTFGKVCRVTFESDDIRQVCEKSKMSYTDAYAYVDRLYLAGSS